AHSSMRGDVRNMSPPAISPTTRKRSCRFQIVATNVGTSVCPAEYRVASPYSASSVTAMTSDLSSWRTRENTVGSDRHGPDLRGRQPELEPGVRQDDPKLVRGRRRVVRKRHAQGRRGLLIDTDGVADGSRDEATRDGAVQCE